MGLGPDSLTDAALLAGTAHDSELFGVFYRRHVAAVLRYLAYKTRRADLAADICAEVFALALEDADVYDPERAPARAWLLMLAQTTMLRSLRRGRVEARARQRLGIPPRELTDADLERVDELVDLERGLEVAAMVDDLPADQREAVRARVLDERDYTEIARDLAVSEAVVRQRVSRGLRTLRGRLEAR